MRAKKLSCQSEKHGKNPNALRSMCFSRRSLLASTRRSRQDGCSIEISQAGSDAHDDGPTTLGALEMTYRDLESCDIKEEFPSPRLWVLYVGAVAEQADKRTDPMDRYFNRTFVALARRMGLTVWDSVEMKPFLYLESFGPMAPHRFAQMMQMATHAVMKTSEHLDHASSGKHMRKSLDRMKSYRIVENRQSSSRPIL